MGVRFFVAASVWILAVALSSGQQSQRVYQKATAAAPRRECAGERPLSDLLGPGATRSREYGALNKGRDAVRLFS